MWCSASHLIHRIFVDLLSYKKEISTSMDLLKVYVTKYIGHLLSQEAAAVPKACKSRIDWVNNLPALRGIRESMIVSNNF